MGRVAVAAFAMAGCGSSGSNAVGGGGSAGHDSGVAASADLGIADLSTAPAPDLADDGKGSMVPDDLANLVIGSYAMQSTTAATQMVPILGKMSSTTVELGLVDIARSGTGLSFTERGCHVTVIGSATAMTTVPDAIPRSVPPTVSSLELVKNGSQVTWKKPAVAVAVGAHLANPDTDALPTTPDDPRVWDQDGDGNPGVTVMISGIVSGKIYVVQRQRAIYSGTVSGPQALSGTVSDASDQSIIGSDNSVLKQNISSTPDPDPSKNPIRFAKLTGAYTCDQLVSQASTLFP
jgi:hypothetical protein